MLDDFPTLVWASGADGKFTYFNKSYLEFTGRTMGEECGNGWVDCVHPDDRERLQELFTNTFAVRQPYEIEYRLRRRDGVYRWVVDRGNPLHDPTGKYSGYIGFCYDTTDRRVMDSARREIEEQARLLGLATRDMVWSWDQRTDRAINNAAFANTLGDLPGPFEASVAWWKERVHPEDLPRVLETLARAMEEGRENASEEYRFRKLDGTYAIVDDRICLERSATGSMVRVLGAMRDITLRKRAEQAQERLTRMLEGTTDFVGMTDASGEIFYVNRAGRRMLGWPLDEPLHPMSHQRHPSGLGSGYRGRGGLCDCRPGRCVDR